MASLVADPGLSPFAIILTGVVLGWISVGFFIFLLSGFAMSSFFVLDGSPAHRSNLCLDGMIPLGRGIQIGCSPLDWRWNSHKQGGNPCWFVQIFQDYQPFKSRRGWTHWVQMISVGETLELKLALPENTTPDSIALFSSSLRNKSRWHITHKVL